MLYSTAIYNGNKEFPVTDPSTGGVANILNPFLLLQTKKNRQKAILFLVEEGGFEPPKSLTADLQSAPFGRSGTLPYSIFGVSSLHRNGAGERTRTPDLLITNQLLYQLSYTSISQCLNNISHLFAVVKHFFSFFLQIAYNNSR